ncbi:MAG: type II secretion system protein M [Deltaproteobacteria bacterium]|nr:type II secretion system protein M [Deltaproteobacteria bacterium]
MNWRERWAQFSVRERRLIGAAGGVLGLFLVHLLVVSPFLSYRQDLQDDIAAHREKIENGKAYLARTADITRQRDGLQKLYQQVHAQLVPGDTPTLAAANLQNTLHSLAGEKGVEIQSTQVMRDDAVGEFRRIAVRITVTGDLKQVADFLAGVEHGQTRVLIPFLEISRRGAVLRGKAARALSATIEVTAFLQGAPAAAGGKAPAAAAGGPAGSAPAGAPSAAPVASPAGGTA